MIVIVIQKTSTPLSSPFRETFVGIICVESSDEWIRVVDKTGLEAFIDVGCCLRYGVRV